MGFFRYAVWCLLLSAVAIPAAPAGAHEASGVRIAELSHQIAHDPAQADLYLLRGETYRHAGEFDAAGADYGTALALGADPVSVAICRGALALDTGHAEAALDILDRVGHPTPPQVHRLRGRAYRARGQDGAAAEAFREALALTRPPRPGDYLDLADALVDAGDPQGALEALDAGIAALGPVASLVGPAMDLELAAGHPEAALGRLEVLAPSPANLARRGDILILCGRPLAAQAAYTEALERLATLPAPRRRTPAAAALSARLHAALSSPAAEEPSPAVPANSDPDGRAP
jgi:tetratricopeptide (TPR) repeat protein